MPAQLPTKSKKRALPGDSAARKNGARYPKQTAAHLYFILSGLCLTTRLVVRTLARMNPPEAKIERIVLHQRLRKYLELLEAWKIVTLEFRGFADCQEWIGSIVAPNHPSIIDAIALFSRVPGLDCVINSQLLHDPVMAGAANLCDFVCNGTPLTMVRACAKRLREGSNILIFPEGTRSITPPLGPFHSGYALAAVKATAPIRTVFIECDSLYFGRMFSFFRPAPCPMTFRLTAGKVFHPRSSDDPRELSAEIEEYFRAGLIMAADGVHLRS